MAKNSILNLSLFSYDGKNYCTFYRYNTSHFSAKPKIVSKKNAKYLEELLRDMRLYTNLSNGTIHIMACPK